MESRAVLRASPGAPVPTGTVTFLFTDVEGSTTRWERYPAAMRDAMRAHDAVMRAAVEHFGGHVFKTVGDAFCVAFAQPRDAAEAALEAQRAFANVDSSAVDGVRVRMAIHLGSTDERDGDYFGPPLNRVARLVAVGHGGQVVLSGVAADVARAGLPHGAELRDLGEHRLRDLTEPERVFQLTASGLQEDFPPLRSLSVLRNNLPLQPSPLLGRDEVVREVVAAVAEARIVSLLGSGGIGKTRIALQAGAELSETMPDGVWFVDLAPLASGAFVADTVGACFDLATSAGRGATESVAQYLRARRLLLILDNCEHVIADAAHVTDAIVRTAPGVCVLTTTREPLAVAGERVLRVPSLDVPPPGEPIGAEDALRFGAIALFVARARAADARFALTDATAPIVADIVRRLDGIALAIELAAARVTVLSVPNLARRLDERFRILTGGSRTALPRQRTMRALIDWSWDLLSATEQTMLRRAAVFAGGWTIDAAEHVCCGEELDVFDVLDTIGSLVDKSLVASEVGARVSRSRLLETTRAYALEQLDRSGERERVALRHASWIAAFCDRMHAAYDASPAWFEEMEAELDNARAALRWSIDNGRPELAARIALRALCGYWWYRAPQEGLRWTEETLARLDQAAEPVLAGALFAIAGSYTRGRRAVAAYERAVAILAPLAEAGVELAPYTRLTYCLGGLGQSLVAAGDTREARAAIERCLALHRSGKETRSRGYAQTLANLGSLLAADGDIAEARTNFEAANALFVSLGEMPGTSVVALARVQAEYASGDVAAAQRYAREAAAINEELKLPVNAAEALADLAACAYVLGDAPAAREHARAALERSAGAYIEAPPAALLTAALLACERDDAAAAVRVGGYVDALESREERRLDLVASDLRERLNRRVSELLAADEVRSLRDDGAALGADDARAEARHALERSG